MAKMLELVDRLKNLSAARVKLLGSMVVVAMPVAWIFTVLGIEYRALEYVAAFLGLGGFLTAMFLLSTHIQRKAARYNETLDEFELRGRLEAQSKAYWWFSTAVLVVLGLGMFLPEFFERIPPNSNGYRMLFIWASTYFAVLPPWLMARQLPADYMETADEL